MNKTEQPTPAFVEEFRELQQVVSDGGSSQTPVIAYANTFVLVALVALVAIALALLAYRLA